MAGNFWLSSHCQQWLLDKNELVRLRVPGNANNLAEEEFQKVMIFFANFIQALGTHLKLRQQLIATATVYFRRFYARQLLTDIDPLLLAPTCIFLAAKVEEYGMISVSKLIAACGTVFKRDFAYAYQNAGNNGDYPYRLSNIQEAEFYLLEMMDCCLIVYQPYRPLLQFSKDFNDQSLLSAAWKICNDSLRTDVCLLFPPHQIALAALHIASVMCNREGMKQWFAELSVDMEKIHEVCRHILSLYKFMKEYNEQKEIGGVLMKIREKINTGGNLKMEMS